MPFDCLHWLAFSLKLILLIVSDSDGLQTTFSDMKKKGDLFRWITFSFLKMHTVVEKQEDRRGWRMIVSFLLHFCLWIKNKPHNNCQDRNRGVTGEEGIGIAIDRYGEAVHRLRVLRRSLPFLLILWFVSGPVVVAFISLILHSTNTIIHTVFL